MKSISRREFVRLSTLVVAGAAVASCARPEATPVAKATETPKPAEVKATEAPKATAKPAAPVSKYQEAPMLAELVKAGKLPPVDERLPPDPYVAKPTEYLGWKGTVGKYGGTWRMATKGAGDNALWARTIAAGGQMIEWEPDHTTGKVRPGVAESWEVSDDGRAFTFHIRKGIRWSDGQPFTTENIRFWYDHVASNKDLSPALPSSFAVGGELAELDVKDDYTFTLTFNLPNGLFLWDIAKAMSELWLVPSHYAEQFHADFVDKAELDEKVKEAEFDDWMQLYDNRVSTRNTNPERATLNPWAVKVGIGEGPQVVFERNPYFFYVDEEGKQLPYIDKAVGKIHPDIETMVLDAISGEIDMQSRFITGQFASFDGIAMVKQNEEKGDYHLTKQCLLPGPSGRIIPFNMTIADPVKREIFRNIDFRRAMSHAINREELWELLSRGLAEFEGPKSASSIQDDEADRIWEELAVYDPDKANELLDKIGLDKKDEEGFRLMPNGERLVVVVETVAVWKDAVSELEMVVEYWEAVGVDTVLKTWDRPLFQDRRVANEAEVACHGSNVSGGVGFPVSLLVDARMLAPVNWESDWGPLWWLWYNSDGKEGEEPPPEVMKTIDIYKEIKRTPNVDGQIELGKQLLRLQAENIWQVWSGPVWLPRCSFIVVKNNLQNVPDELPWSWWYPSPGPTQTYMYYFDPPQKF